MNFVFLMDPLHTVNPLKDTSFIFMVGAHRAGHKVFFLPQGGTSLVEDNIIFDVTQVIPHHPNESTSPDQDIFTIVEDNIQLTHNDVDVVFVRTEPPFDSAYLMDTWLLDRLPSHIPVINSPAGIRTVNEKIWATQFTDLIPTTLITRQKEKYIQFLNQHNKVVVKPTDGFGGAGVFIVNKEDSNATVIFETLSENESKELIIQRFIPEAKQGDKRILLLNGQIISAVLRVQDGQDHRNNFFAGGHPEPAEITQRDQEVVDTLRPHLQQLGLHFVGIDMLGDYLIEVNVTSPTCIQECNTFDDAQYEDQVIQYVEELIEQHNSVSTL